MTDASIAIIHGIGEKIQTAVKDAVKKTTLRKHYDKVGSADATGACTLTFDGPKQGFVWYVERIFADIGGGSLLVYVGKVQDSNIKDSSPSANKASLDNASPIFVQSNNEFSVVFAGGAVGAKALANIQVREVEIAP